MQEDIAFVVTTATTPTHRCGCPFTQWSVRKLAADLGRGADRRVRIGRARLRQILREHEITFQRTRTWKESRDPDKEAKLQFGRATLPDHDRQGAAHRQGEALRHGQLHRQGTENAAQPAH